MNMDIRTPSIEKEKVVNIITKSPNSDLSNSYNFDIDGMCLPYFDSGQSKKEKDMKENKKSKLNLNVKNYHKKDSFQLLGPKSICRFIPNGNEIPELIQP